MRRGAQHDEALDLIEAGCQGLLEALTPLVRGLSLRIARSQYDPAGAFWPVGSPALPAELEQIYGQKIGPARRYRGTSSFGDRSEKLRVLPRRGGGGAPRTTP